MIIIKTIPLFYLLLCATGIRKNKMPLKKIQEKTVRHSGITFLQNVFLNFIFLLTCLMAWGTGILKSLLSKNIQLDTWWLLSSCIKVHLFRNSNVLQHDYILHRKYFNLLIFVPFISSLLTIVI